MRAATTTARPAPRVLLAEDNQAMRSFLADVLRADGYEVLEASDGRELFWLVETAAADRGIDVVVSDLRMPAYDGLDVVEAWAELGAGPRVVLMSAFPDPEVHRRAGRLGVVLLDKPFAVSRLRRLLGDMTSGRSGPPD